MDVKKLRRDRQQTAYSSTTAMSFILSFEAGRSSAGIAVKIAIFDFTNTEYAFCLRGGLSFLVSTVLGYTIGVTRITS